MKSKSTLPVIILLLALSFRVNAQEKESRNIGEFTKINVSSGINLYLTQGDEISLSIECDKSEMHKVITDIDGSTLHIYNKNDYTWSLKKAPKVYLTVKALKAITAGGGADVYGQNIINANALSIATSGGADIYIDVECEEIDLKTSGGSDIKIKGSAKNVKASASGGSDIDAEQLKARYVTASTSGGADIKVWAEESLNAKASGGSDIFYHGNPVNKNIEESGGGDVKKL